MSHLRFLRYLDEVARAGSIRHAAEVLHVAPSAINRRIQDIENEIGTPLFERVTRGMRLTAAGEIFVRHIRDRFSDLERALSEIEELKGLRRGTVRLVASQGLTTEFLPEVIRAFRQKRPLISFDVQIADHVQAATALREFTADLALAFNLAPDADLKILDWVEQKFVALMHKNHPLAKKATIQLGDCAEYPLLLPSRDTGVRQLLSRFLARSSLRLNPALESNSFELLRYSLYDQRSVSFTLGLGTDLHNKNIVTRNISDSAFPVGRLTLAALNGRQLPLSAYSFIDLVRDRFIALRS